MTGAPAEHVIGSADGTAVSYLSVGRGPGLIIIGGVLRSAVDYLPLATVLGKEYEVHVMNRRGRAGSGGQGPGYSLRKECEDLSALQLATGATVVFGHSYGGLIALETVRTNGNFDVVAAYEPPLAALSARDVRWFATYEAMLARGDTRRAFAYFVRAVGHVPPVVKRLPLWHMRAILRVAIRQQEWLAMEPLLATNLLEHRQLALRSGELDDFAEIAARVLLLGGAKSPEHARAPLYDLGRLLRDPTIVVLPGLDHIAPEKKGAEAVGQVLLDYLDNDGDGTAEHARVASTVETMLSSES